MASVQVNFKIDSKVKTDAQKIANKMGLSLSDVINGCVREFIRTKTLNFSISEEPSDYLIKSLKKSEEENKKGDYYHFDNPEGALGFIDKIIKEKEKKLKNKNKAKK